MAVGLHRQNPDSPAALGLPSWAAEERSFAHRRICIMPAVLCDTPGVEPVAEWWRPATTPQVRG
jgi:hypothetical protein